MRDSTECISCARRGKRASIHGNDDTGQKSRNGRSAEREGPRFSYVDVADGSLDTADAGAGVA